MYCVSPSIPYGVHPTLSGLVLGKITSNRIVRSIVRSATRQSTNTVHVWERVTATMKVLNSRHYWQATTSTISTILHAPLIRLFRMGADASKCIYDIHSHIGLALHIWSEKWWNGETGKRMMGARWNRCTLRYRYIYTRHFALHHDRCNIAHCGSQGFYTIKISRKTGTGMGMGGTGAMCARSSTTDSKNNQKHV